MLIIKRKLILIIDIHKKIMFIIYINKKIMLIFFTDRPKLSFNLKKLNNTKKVALEHIE